MNMGVLKLNLFRDYKKATYTIGNLYINGEWFCNTLEDTDRGLTMNDPETKIKFTKVYGKTAIPKGVYRIDLNTKSARFSNKSSYQFCHGYLPRLVNVPGFSGILIHIGNTAEDTEGCILVGLNKAKGKVLQSTETFKKLYAILDKANLAGDKIELEID